MFQLGNSSGHHYCSCESQQDWLRCVRGVGGLVLGQDQRSRPGPVDAADWKDLGVLGVPHPPLPLHPDQEAHPHSGEEDTRDLIHQSCVHRAL